MKQKQYGDGRLGGAGKQPSAALEASFRRSDTAPMAMSQPILRINLGMKMTEPAMAGAIPSRVVGKNNTNSDTRSRNTSPAIWLSP